MHIGRAIASLVAVAGGTMLGSISIIGILGNYDEWEVHSCSQVQPYPVCGSIIWLIVELIFFAAIGVTLVVAGLLYLGREMAPHEIPSAQHAGSKSHPPHYSAGKSCIC